MNSDLSPEDANPRLLRHLERHQKQKQRQAVLFRLLLIAALIAIVAKVDFSQILGEMKQAAASLTRMNPATANLPNPTNSCDTVMPPNGSTYLFDPSAIRRSDVVYSGLSLNNQHNFPVELLIGSADRQTNYQAVLILPQGGTEVSLPVGSYSLSLLVGGTWCNVNEGFSDGHRVVVNNLIDILPGKTNQVRFEPIGPKDTDIHLVSTQVDLQGPTQATQQQAPDSAFVPSNTGNGTIIELRRQANGGFYINGTVNHVPIVFQIDTGASITSIPKELALSAGIYACDGRMFDTANGQAFGCLAIAKELTFGNNRIEGFQVASMLGLKNGLLGMNILRHFKIENVGDVMRISSAEPTFAPPTQYVPASQPPMPVAVAPQPVAPDDADIMANRKELCEKSYDTDKGYINARMRHAYSAQEGEVFREQLRQIQQRYDECLAAIS